MCVEPQNAPLVRGHGRALAGMAQLVALALFEKPPPPPWLPASPAVGGRAAAAGPSRLQWALTGRGSYGCCAVASGVCMV